VSTAVFPFPAWRRLVAVAGRETRFRFSNFGWLFWDLFYPTGYLLALGAGLSALLVSDISGGSYSAFLLPGILVMAGQTLAVNSSWALFMDRDNGIFYEHLTYPLTRADFLGGRLLFNLGMGGLQSIILVAAAGLVLRVPMGHGRALLLVGAGLAAIPFWFFALFAAAIRIRRMDAYSTFLNVVFLGALLLSPVFYPIEPMPGWFQVVAELNPLTWSVDILRAIAFGGVTRGKITIELAAYVAATAAAFVWALRSLRTALR
jgi:ABC-type polysaccharide/polyol phosphate export permease